MLGEELVEDSVDQNVLSAMISANLEDVYLSDPNLTSSSFNVVDPLQVFGIMPTLQPMVPIDDSSEPCQLCNRLIKKKGMLAHIQRVHSGELQNVINQDSSSNSSGSSTPDDTKERCKFCPRFIKKKGMKAHIERVHSNAEKTFQCSHCSKKFKFEQYLKTHVKKYHPIIYSCMKCEVICRSQIEIETHVKVEHGIDLDIPWNLNSYVKVQPTVVKKKATA